jgi:hypothetical protein
MPFEGNPTPPRSGDDTTRKVVLHKVQSIGKLSDEGFFVHLTAKDLRVVIKILGQAGAQALHQWMIRVEQSH